MTAPHHEPLGTKAFEQLFLDARTHGKWLDREVPDALLKQLTDMVKMGPTSANCSPAPLVFVKSVEAKKLM